MLLETTSKYTESEKAIFSVNIQMIVDYSLTLTDVVARWLGSVHDSTIFDHSYIRGKLETENMTDGYLRYPCRRYLLTPLIQPMMAAEKRYNEWAVS